jgi:lactate dehydrogenase-like 2-hydroxyacid dehydrogenase
VDTDALLDGLQSFQVGGYGMDVYENESEIFFRCVKLYVVYCFASVRATANGRVVRNGVTPGALCACVVCNNTP